MRIVVFGTGPFCVPTLKSLLDSDHEVPAVVTRPIEDAGKRRKTLANPVRETAVDANLVVLDPQTCNAGEFIEQLKSFEADLFFVCDYGQIMSRDCLESARLGGINLHGSLLPRYRGAAPIQWAIYNGDKELGVSVIHMTPKMDAGPILATEKKLFEQNQNSDEIELELSRIGIAAVRRAIQLLDAWDGNSSIGEKQDPSLATPAPRIKKSDGKLDWNRTAIQLVNQIRAFTPWPTSFCQWKHGKQPLRLIVQKASVVNIETNAPAGVIVAAEKNLLAIQTANGALSIERIQPAGKKSMPIADFLRGNQLTVGQTMD